MKNTKILSAVALTAVALSSVPFSTVLAADSGAVVSDIGNGGTSAGTTVSGSTPALGSGRIGIGFASGSLTLNQVPNFDFGYHTIGDNTTFGLLAPGEKPQAGDGKTSGATMGRQLVVTDQRDIRTDPWSVTVGVSQSIGLTGATLSLNASNISYGSWAGNDTALSSGGGRYFESGTGNTAGLSASPVADLALDATPTPTPQTVFSVADATKVDPGTYALDFSDQSTASIKVPLPAQKAGEYTGTLVWTLSAGTAH
ncbi:WxL domain-containing protein [Schleiferilactobacillus harbinensis]|jgi:hypothetical protein|uniref:WxL domain-containing protein n=1 Tax=Schleiferilactobacillus harbinensis TaxID=304207 RepID=UPI00242A69E8|nr:WxL domain-containing protein [Schleiferilactobacillus harbinensis]MCI1851955.1 WxL domain-containing protein [Schleiferilactobacillus harbinensis]